LSKVRHVLRRAYKFENLIFPLLSAY